MEKFAYRVAHAMFHSSRSTYYVFHLLALGSFLMLIAMPIQAEAPTSTLKTALLNRAFAENLVRQPVPLNDDYASKLSPLNPRRQIGSMKVGLRWLLILPIRLHQEVITHQDGDVCTFQPSCSHYGLAAIRRHGLKGLLMASDRLLRCHSGNHKYYPVYSGSAYDSVPPK